MKKYRCLFGFHAVVNFGTYRSTHYFSKGTIITEEKYNALGIVGQVGHWEEIKPDTDSSEGRRSAALEFMNR